MKNYKILLGMIVVLIYPSIVQAWQWHWRALNPYEDWLLDKAAWVVFKGFGWLWSWFIFVITHPVLSMVAACLLLIFLGYKGKKAPTGTPVGAIGFWIGYIYLYCTPLCLFTMGVLGAIFWALIFVFFRFVDVLLFFVTITMDAIE